MKGADFGHCVVLRYVTLLFRTYDHVIEKKKNCIWDAWTSSCFSSVGSCSDSQRTGKIGVKKRVFTFSCSPFSVLHLSPPSPSYYKSFELALAFAEDSSLQPLSLSQICLQNPLTKRKHFEDSK